MQIDRKVLVSEDAGAYKVRYENRPTYCTVRPPPFRRFRSLPSRCPHFTSETTAVTAQMYYQKTQHLLSFTVQPAV